MALAIGFYDDRGSEAKYRTALCLPCSTARRYNRTCEELERLKESIGFNKPFPFLRLPREIRDKIYTYSLCAAVPVGSATDLIIPRRDNPSKPPTSGLLSTNKQVYHEAIDILYPKNIFKFRVARKLFAFEDQIGLENRKRVREIIIWTIFPVSEERLVPTKYLLRSEYGSHLPHWIAALKACDLQKIVHLGIEAKKQPASSPLSLLSMPRDLQGCIEEFLGRAADNEVPRLSLTGFKEEREKFPKTWEVVMDQWDFYEDEIRRLQEKNGGKS